MQGKTAEVGGFKLKHSSDQIWNHAWTASWSSMILVHTLVISPFVSLIYTEKNPQTNRCLKRVFQIRLDISHELSAKHTVHMGAVGWGKVSCILRHWVVQLILAYSWARPATLVAGKCRGGMFLLLLFLHFYSFSPFSPVPLFLLLYYLFYLSSPFLWETTQNDPQGLTCR